MKPTGELEQCEIIIADSYERILNDVRVSRRALEAIEENMAILIRNYAQAIKLCDDAQNEGPK